MAYNESNKFDPRKRYGEVERDQIVSLLFAAKVGDLNTIRRIYVQGIKFFNFLYDQFIINFIAKVNFKAKT